MAYWEPFEPAAIQGEMLGILGYGDIGRAAVERAKGFGMRILACLRRPERSAGDPLVDQVLPFEQRWELAAASDYLLLAMPHPPDTQRLVGEAELQAMKPQAVLINVGGGSTVDEPAPVRALDAQRCVHSALWVRRRRPHRLNS